LSLAIANEHYARLFFNNMGCSKGVAKR